MKPAQDTLDHEKPLQQDEPQSLSLLGGVARPDDLPGADDFTDTTSTSKRWISQSTLLLVLVAGIATGGLYLMRAMQGEIEMADMDDAVAAKIELALAKHAQAGALADDDPLRRENISALLDDTDEIVEMFANDATRHQVPIEYIKKNPFTLPALAPVDDGAQTIQLADKREQDRLNALRAELDELELQTVMASKNPVAIISGVVVKVGQSIGSFKVVKINKRAVIMENAERRFVLEMPK